MKKTIAKMLAANDKPMDKRMKIAILAWCILTAALFQTGLILSHRFGLNHDDRESYMLAIGILVSMATSLGLIKIYVMIWKNNNN